MSERLRRVLSDDSLLLRKQTYLIIHMESLKVRRACLFQNPILRVALNTTWQPLEKPSPNTLNSPGILQQILELFNFYFNYFFS